MPMTGGSSRTSRRHHEPGPCEHRPGCWSGRSRVSTIAHVHARVEYVTTSDGVRIAYARHGRGPTVVWMPPFPARHVELEWEQPGDRRWLEWLASRYTLLQYDPRGLGLSDPSVTSFSLEAFERDLHAVIERAAGDGAIVFAKVNSGAQAIAYAVHHPELVSNLVLWCATPALGKGSARTWMGSSPSPSATGTSSCRRPRTSSGAGRQGNQRRRRPRCC